MSPSATKYPNRPYALVLSRPSATKAPAFATFTYPESLTDESTLRITYLRQPIPFEALVAVAQRAGCSKISMWGGRGGWDDVGSPDLDHDAEMPCYVVYGQDTEAFTWHEPEL